MPTQTVAKPEKAGEKETLLSIPARTVIGWQGVRCMLPPEWNVSGLSMDRDNGSLRVDSPGNGTMTVLIKWFNVAKPNQGMPNLYTYLAPKLRKWRKRPDPPLPKPDLKANLEKMLKDTAKQAKREKAGFESSIKPEKTEGEDGERTAINFTWTGAGRGQGKIWYCSVCNRVVVAQVLGLAKDHNAIATVASQLFSSLHDHPEEGYDRWALYDLQAEIPADFRLEAQKLLSGYLNLTFGRGGERIVIDRWGLANMTLKKFKLEEWFRNNTQVNLKRMERQESETPQGHKLLSFSGVLPLTGRVRALREAKGSLRRFPTRYEAGIWECPESNKLYAIQVWHNRRTEGLWTELVKRCVCHG